MRTFLLRFFTRNGCPLCEEGLAIVERATRRKRVEIEVVDIDESDRLTAEYGLRIPVVEDTDGNVLAEGELDFRSFRKALRQLR